jgi:Recombination endonuclease VII
MPCRCGEADPANFYPGYASECKRCKAERAMAWRNANRARWNRSRHKLRSMRKFGLTSEQYETLMAPGCCEACGSTERVCIDHDHATGAVRGLLCHHCNRMLPESADPALLRRLADYLETRA